MAKGNGASVIWTPDGVKPVDGGKALTRIELRPGAIEWFRQAADFFAHHNLGLHCAECGADVTGKNADTDATFSAACGCREWVGQNRDYLKPIFKN